MSVTYKDVKEYNQKYIIDDIDWLAGAAGGEHSKDRDACLPIWDYCEAKIDTCLLLLEENPSYGFKLGTDHYYTVIYCRLYEWFDTLSTEDQVTLTLLGFEL